MDRQRWATAAEAGLRLYWLSGGRWGYTGSLADGSTTWAELAEGWGTTGTVFVFLGWGVAVAVTTVGYQRAVYGGRAPVVASTDAFVLAGRAGEAPVPVGDPLPSDDR